MRTAWICTQCLAGSVGDSAHVLRYGHELFTAHRTESVDPRLANEMLGDIVLRERFTEIDFPSLGEGVPQLVIASNRALGGEQPGEGDLLRGKMCPRCLREECDLPRMPEVVWQEVVRGRWPVLCATCFEYEQAQFYMSQIDLGGIQ